MIENDPGGLSKRRFRRARVVSEVVTVRLKRNEKGMSSKEHWGRIKGEKGDSPDVCTHSAKEVLAAAVTC